MKRKICLYALAAGILVAATSPEPAPAQDFAVIVNAANPVTAMSKDDVAKLFLKKQISWESGQSVAAVELPMTTRAREAFARDVLGKTIPQVKAYWQQQIFSGRDIPLPEKPSENDVIAFVRSNANAIGYVSKGVDVGRGVKVIALAP
jgi:ABC-type phosphate transport system substrate-binding protein